MLTMLIADDEPKIRRGLADAFDWNGLGIKIAGFAGNGAETLQKVAELHPDICLVDINMPILNGLDLIEKLREKDSETVCIVITGYDEFDYAQRAVRLGVFDYVLKPVVDDILRSTIERSVTFITEREKHKGQLVFAQQMLIRNMPVLRERFLNDLISGVLTQQEIAEQLTFHKIVFPNKMGFAMLKIEDDIISQSKAVEWDRQLLRFAVRNVFEESIALCGSCVAAVDSRENLFALSNIVNREKWNGIKAEIEQYIEQNFSRSVKMTTAVLDSFDELADLYDRCTDHLDESASPLIALARRSIDRNYANPEISFQKLSDELNISAGYLSKLFKHEMGMTFIDYLTRVRIQEAIALLNDPSLRVYDIAERVGYHSQHYFCAAFKRVLGVSPTEYRQRKR